MDFLEMMKPRFSVRSYNDKPVEKEKLEKILEAGRIAPTGKNLQHQKFIVLESKESMEKLAKCTRLMGAPVAIIVCGDKENAWTRQYDNKSIEDIDASIATTYMMAEATSLGLATLWMCMFKPEIMKAEFEIPENLVPVNLLLVGYTDEEPKSVDRYSTDRKPIEDFVLKTL